MTVGTALPDRFAIRSFYGQFLSISKDGKVESSVDPVLFSADGGGSDELALSVGDFFLCFAEDGSLSASTSKSRIRVEEREVWAIALPAPTGDRYVKVDRTGAITLSTYCGRAETFLVEDERVLAAVKSLREEGYVVLKGLFPREEATAMLELVRSLEESGKGVKYHMQHRIGEIAHLHPTLCLLLLQPVMLATLRGFLGDYMRCATWSSNTIFSQDGSFMPTTGWHVDYPYHDIEQPWPDVVLGAQVLWLLEDFYFENGATMFLPGTQKLLRSPSPGFESPPEAKVLEDVAGSVLISHSAWWHRQGTNVSGRPRSCVLGNFVRGFVIPKSNMEEELEHVLAAEFENRLSAPQVASLRSIMLGPHGRALKGFHQ